MLVLPYPNGLRRGLYPDAAPRLRITAPKSNFSPTQRKFKHCCILQL